jgi:Domain of unknown function (DUF4169)
MAEVINLRRARKAKTRAEKAGMAAESRARSSRTAHERKLATTLEEKRNRTLDLLRRAESNREK